MQGKAQVALKNWRNLFWDQREDSLTSLEVCHLLKWKQITSYRKAVFPLASKAVFKLSDPSPCIRFPWFNVQWESEKQTSQVFKWSKAGWSVSNFVRLMLESHHLVPINSHNEQVKHVAHLQHCCFQLSVSSLSLLLLLLWTMYEACLMLISTFKNPPLE